MNTYYDHWPSPVGPLLMVTSPLGLTHLLFAQTRTPVAIGAEWKRDDAPFREVRDQLTGYFDGTRQNFDLLLAPQGTDFQCAVWAEMLRIPYGETTSYGDIARRVADDVTASRAVGAANGQNPIAIIVPCHRVIGANGKLTGYGGGLPRKKFLLDLEQKHRAFALTP